MIQLIFQVYAWKVSSLSAKCNGMCIFSQPHILMLKAGTGQILPQNSSQVLLCLSPPTPLAPAKRDWRTSHPAAAPLRGGMQSQGEMEVGLDRAGEDTELARLHAHTPQCKQLLLSAPSSLLTFIIQNARGRNAKQDQKEYEIVAWSQTSQWEVLGHPPRRD